MSRHVPHSTIHNTYILEGWFALLTEGVNCDVIRLDDVSYLNSERKINRIKIEILIFFIMF